MEYPKLVGVLHLDPLPGSPGAHGKDPRVVLAQAAERATLEADILTRNGFDGLILENFGDTPFYKTQTPPETVASMAVLSALLRDRTEVKIGVNVLRNDAQSALAIAAVTGCDFIRVNVLSGVSATDQGLIEGDAAHLVREKFRLGALEVKIFADVHVKHSRSLSSKAMSLAVEETLGRGGGDAVIVTGSTTGRSPDLKKVQRAYEVALKSKAPLYLGSGISSENIAEFKGIADGVIIGSDLRKSGEAGASLDTKRVEKFAKAFLKSWS